MEINSSRLKLQCTLLYNLLHHIYYIYIIYLIVLSVHFFFHEKEWIFEFTLHVEYAQ